MAQTEPTIDLEKQDPSCSGNGRITALLQNSDNAGNLVYNLFQLPSETLLASNANGFFEGLDAGLYKLSANFTIDDSPQEISVEETLNSVYNPLSFTVISKTICENELGSIEVFVNEGAPASYELLGPSERPAQESV